MRIVLIAACMASLTATACSKTLGVHRIEASANSPYGRYVAFVRNLPAIDPPRQSLWLREATEPTGLELLALAEDQDWCRVIVWSADSSLVAFLVQEAWVAVFEAGNGELLLRSDLVERNGYPTRRAVQQLRFGPTNRNLQYEVCDRATMSRCTEAEILLSVG